MTESEMAKTFKVLQAVYPGKMLDVGGTAVNAWLRWLGKYPQSVVDRGIDYYVANDTKGFPPSVGQLLDAINKTSPAVVEALTENEAWDAVAKALRNSGYNAAEEFNRLPNDLIRRVVGSPATLNRWANMDSATVHSIEKSNFLKSYRAELAKAQSLLKMPELSRPALPSSKPVMIETKRVEVEEDVLTEEEERNRQERIHKMVEEFAKKHS